MREGAVEARAGNRNDGFTPELRHLVPDATYRIDDRFTYKTNADGQVIEAHADSLLYRPAKGKNSLYRNGDDQRNVGNLPRPNKEDYHGGHLIADVFGGPGDKLNIIPMDKVLNGSGGGWGLLEADFRKILKADPNARIEYNVKLDYSGGKPQPDRITIEYQINGGQIKRERFGNV